MSKEPVRDLIGKVIEEQKPAQAQFIRETVDARLQSEELWQSVVTRPVVTRQLARSSWAATTGLLVLATGAAVVPALYGLFHSHRAAAAADQARDDANRAQVLVSGIEKSADEASRSSKAVQELMKNTQTQVADNRAISELKDGKRMEWGSIRPDFDASQPHVRVVKFGFQQPFTTEPVVTLTPLTHNSGSTAYGFVVYRYEFVKSNGAYTGLVCALIDKAERAVPRETMVVVNYVVVGK